MSPSTVLRCLAASAALTLTTHLAGAQTTYTWALTGNASGTWDLTTPDWNPGPTTWANSTGPGNIAQFGVTTGAPSAINVAVPITLSELRFTDTATGFTDRYVFNNNSLTFDGNSTISAAGGNNYRINSVIAGSSGLLMTRTGSFSGDNEIRLAVKTLTQVSPPFGQPLYLPTIITLLAPSEWAMIR